MRQYVGVPRLFINFTRGHRDVADTIDAALGRAGIGTATRWEISSPQDWGLVDEQALRAADALVVILPPASTTPWEDSEAEFALTRELDRRGVELIPVRATPVELSPVMRDRAAVDLTESSGINRLIAQIRTMSRIDFAAMNPPAFENLVADLLRALGFDDVRSEPGVDLRATYRRTDPFGLPENQTWLVETKLYSHERVSVRVIQQLADALALAPNNTHGLLVTNAQLTSVAEEHITELDHTVSLRILDGVRLRRLLREYPAVAARHFDDGTKVFSGANT